MSMIGTLGKIAMGIMVAKGVGSVLGKSGSNSGSTGGIGDMLGGLLGGGGSAAAGGLGGLLNSLSGKGQTETKTASNTNTDLGSLLSSAFTGTEAKTQPSEEEKAKIILKAMISAAKSDGKLDADEQKKITEYIGDVTQEELDFVKQELNAPLDLDALIQSVPQDMAQQVYMMSLLTINLDEQSEVQYLDKLAKGLKITPEVANEIHKKLNAPTIYNS